MKASKVLLLILVFAMIWGAGSPGLAATALAAPPRQPNAPDAIVVLQCNLTGTGGDLIDRGIRFTLNQSFSQVELRMAGSVAGTYSFQAHLRRSTGFTSAPIANATVSATLPVFTAGVPYQPVRINFGATVPVAAAGETFTVALDNLSGASTTAYFEVFGIGVNPCAPAIQETDENNVAVPTVRGGLAGFKVLKNDPSSFSLASTWVNTPPQIDGSINFGEWNLSNQLPFDNGFISVVNDGIRLYVLLDVTGETVNNPTNSDYFWVTFDVNKDSAITPNVDLNYGLDPRNGNMRYSFYLKPAEWTGMQPNTLSSRGRGYGCFWADGSFSFISFFPLRITCNQHRVWELAIDLSEIGATPGSNVRMGVRAESNSPSFTNEIPANFDVDFSNLINVSLAASPYFTLAPLAGAGVAFNANPIEITQAVQHPNDSLSLVANKATAARVYGLTTNVPFGQYTKVLLYGSSGGVDRPGSPLATTYTAPTVINRNSLNSSANFSLPASWLNGTVTFSSYIADFQNPKHTASTGGTTLAYTPKSALTVWIVPINAGTNQNPVLVAQSEIDRQESYMRAIYPLSNINFVQKSWTVLGPTTVNNAISALNTYYSNVVFAWIISVIFLGKQPYTLPDQIYGFTPSGGGLSDPVWAGGAGRVARGFIGTSGEGTMAHEINHNLDRSANGTWGRHVNPNGTGCGAAGPDPSWPYANPNINEVGFDTRFPWHSSGSSLTVIPSTVPDIMSYCGSGFASPTKWISDYRWSNLFNNFTTSASDQMLAQVQEQLKALQASGQAPTQVGFPPMYYVSGQINRDGTGVLNPLLVQPGIASLPPQSDVHNAAIIFMDAAGKPTSTTNFNIEFLDDPEEPVNTAHFNFQIPVPVIIGLAPTAGGKVVLQYNGNTIAEIDQPSQAPTIAITSPKGGENAKGSITVSWTATVAQGATASFNVLYSNDNGNTWLPLASNLTGNSLDVDLSKLPGGAQAMFKVVVSDGFNNAEANSPTFTSAGTPPDVTILKPAPGDVAAPGTTLTLSGEATDQLGNPVADDSLAWSEGTGPDAVALGTGGEITASLAPGLHTLTLTATDSLGQTGQAQVTVLIGSRLFVPFVIR